MKQYPDTNWALYLVTKYDFIYAWVDGQFSDDYNHSKNEALLDELIDDYTALMDFIQTNLTFINLDKTCLLGNNVGASLVLYTLSSQTSLIKCGIVNSPIVDWNNMRECPLTHSKFPK